MTIDYNRRSDALRAVLALVRDTGQNAHPRDWQGCSDIVRAVAAEYDMSADKLQAEVFAWDAYLDGLRYGT